MESMTGFEAFELILHDSNEEFDDGDAIFGPVTDYGWEGHGLAPFNRISVLLEIVVNGRGGVKGSV